MISVRNRNRRKESIVLISTNMELATEEINRTHLWKMMGY